MNSGNSKTSEPHVLILKPTGKTGTRTGEKSILYQIFVFTIHGIT